MREQSLTPFQWWIVQCPSGWKENWQVVGPWRGQRRALLRGERTNHRTVTVGNDAWTTRGFLKCDCEDRPTSGASPHLEGETVLMFIYGDPICTILRQNSAKFLMTPGEVVQSYAHFWILYLQRRCPYPTRPGYCSSPASHPGTSFSEKDAAFSTHPA